MTKFLWIIGSPRSGSTFLCDFLGKYTDKVYNEPWASHAIETPRLWKFPPKAKTITFKYCENWRNIHVLTNHYPDSHYIHIWRDPDNVVHSMCYPRKNSYPPRNLYGGHTKEDRQRLCMQRWYSNMMHCLYIYNILPNQYLEVKYENMKPGLKDIAEKTGLSLKLDELGFENRNTDTILDWDLNLPAKKLRNFIDKYDGESNLAQFINRYKPKLLQRVIL